ncbi:unnamed protein product [Phyllotreta striolata]|uniref:Uncharacterized protein n=1 Tax=Phyllotreta striolata TaxID=444603 RepID=A0A9N9TMS6_PHYSR|nr:unnamed protein product [Phyllotreta striolata]
MNYLPKTGKFNVHYCDVLVGVIGRCKFGDRISHPWFMRTGGIV